MSYNKLTKNYRSFIEELDKLKMVCYSVHKNILYVSIELSNTNLKVTKDALRNQVDLTNFIYSLKVEDKIQQYQKVFKKVNLKKFSEYCKSITEANHEFVIKELIDFCKKNKYSKECEDKFEILDTYRDLAWRYGRIQNKL